MFPLTEDFVLRVRVKASPVEDALGSFVIELLPGARGAQVRRSKASLTPMPTIIAPLVR